MSRSFMCDRCKTHVLKYSPFATVHYDPDGERTKDLCKKCFLKIFSMNDSELPQYLQEPNSVLNRKLQLELNKKQGRFI